MRLHAGDAAGRRPDDPMLDPDRAPQLAHQTACQTRVARGAIRAEKSGWRKSGAACAQLDRTHAYA